MNVLRTSESTTRLGAHVHVHVRNDPRRQRLRYADPEIEPGGKLKLALHCRMITPTCRTGRLGWAGFQKHGSRAHAAKVLT